MIPQYAKSTDPDVLATLERNEETETRFRRRVEEFVQQVGASQAAASSSFGRWELKRLAFAGAGTYRRLPGPGGHI